MAGGYLADRFSKRSVLIGVKIFKIPVMTVALIGLAIGNLWVAITGMVLMSVHSAIFGPSKYGILPNAARSGSKSQNSRIIELGVPLDHPRNGGRRAALQQVHGTSAIFRIHSR